MEYDPLQDSSVSLSSLNLDDLSMLDSSFDTAIPFLSDPSKQVDVFANLTTSSTTLTGKHVPANKMRANDTSLRENINNDSFWK